MPERELFKQAPEMLANGGLAAIGGSANYLHKVYKGQAFKTMKFLINNVLAATVGILVISFVPRDYEYRDSVIFLSGFCALPILDMLESVGWKYVANFFLRAMKLPELPLDEPTK